MEPRGETNMREEVFDPSSLFEHWNKLGRALVIS